MLKRKKSPEKEILKLEGKGRKYSSRLLFIIHLELWSLQLEKFIFVTFFFSLPLGGVGGVGESWLLTHACHRRLGRTGHGLGTFDSPVLKAAFDSAKIS